MSQTADTRGYGGVPADRLHAILRYLGHNMISLNADKCGYARHFASASGRDALTGPARESPARESGPCRYSRLAASAAATAA